MLTIQRFVVNMVAENCYVVNDATLEAVVIDCGVLYPEEAMHLRDYVTSHNLRVRHLLQTHCHFDHIFGAGFAYKQWEVLPEMHRNEVKLYRALPKQLAVLLHRQIPIVQPPVGRIFEWGDEFCFGGHSLVALASPGHTPGGTCFYCPTEGLLFSGDSLFRGAIGRTDFPGGDAQKLVRSLKENILTLPESTTVLPGHGEQTTIGWEKVHNPYLLGASDA